VRGEAVQHRRRCIAALVLAGFAGAILSGHLKSGSTTTTTTSHVALSTTTSTVVHSSVKVLVGETARKRGQRGRALTQQLQQQGWSLSSPVNATATASSTAVYYAPGQQAAAALIASELGAPASAVQPLSATVPVPTTTGLDVVVVIGSDLAGKVSRPRPSRPDRAISGRSARLRSPAR